MEQAQFGVLEMDWFIASLRAFTRPSGAQIRWGGHPSPNQPPQPPVASALQNNPVNYSQDVIFWTTSEV
jgi:hypothetical protein